MAIRHLQLTDYAAAWERYEEARPVYAAIGDRPGEAFTSWFLRPTHEGTDPARAAELMQVCVGFERDIADSDAQVDAAHVAQIRQRTSDDQTRCKWGQLRYVTHTRRRQQTQALRPPHPPAGLAHVHKRSGAMPALAYPTTDPPLNERAERLRQERETFEQLKSQSSRWFALRLAMGWAATAIAVSVLAIAAYVLRNRASFPETAVVLVSGALVGDIAAAAFAIWKLAFSAGLFVAVADWGDGDATVDLADELNARIANDKITLRATVQELGVDPAPVREKTLLILYEYAGKRLAKEVRENDIVSLP